MKQKFRYYTETFKLQVIEEILSGQLTKEQARKKYQIKGKSGILNWMRKFGLSGHKTMPAYFASMKEDTGLSKEDMLKRIRQLERQLEDAQIKAAGYSRMIDLAEEQLKIKIRKKSNTKQSGK